MHNNVLKTWLDSSFLTKNNQSYINQIYKNFLKNPNSIDHSWLNVFQDWEKEISSKNQISIKTDLTSDHNIMITIVKLLQLINSFRLYGHQYAILDPLGSILHNSKNNFLELEYYKFSEQNLHTQYNIDLLGLHHSTRMNIVEIYNFLKNIYCGSIGIEYMHILDNNKMLWIQKKFESTVQKYNQLSSEEQKQFFTEIIAAEGLERYLGIKFPGMKRFSLEGGDALIPLLKEVIRYSSINYNVKNIFLGMAHRGRLNVLINVFGKNPQNLFNEFYGKHQDLIKSGDVKYHQGLYSNVTINGCTVYLSLLSNPSHLEIVAPIVMGVTRSKIDELFRHMQKDNKSNVNIQNETLPIIIHGDAAISAQGVVQETFNMANTRAYSVGGTIHIVINNQIGFTTSNLCDIRSTPYCTDIAKMIQAPILHVNADDVNAVVFAIRFALNFRNKFHHDIIIDLICYRRHGHNESDEPSVTQPKMYQIIRQHPTVVNIYSNILIKNKIINVNDVENIAKLYRSKLENENCLLEHWKPVNIRSTYHLNNSDRHHFYPIKKIDKQYLQKLAYRISDIPLNITMHDRVKKIYDERIEMALGKRLFDWGGAETLAYATLLDQGYSIRLSGEDVARGTFFHRHSVIYDQNHETQYIPLTHIDEKQGSFFIWDSVLSEESALAFEYGYSSISSNTTLVLWEAQFGDFSNGAQIVIDQFISSSEQKWNQLCGLIMLLPHGYDGQGPEHSSCRVERYLQLCAEFNIRVCIPSTPAQIYHILHQHANNNVRRPLIIISPKSLLRNTQATSTIEDLAYGCFKTVFHEINHNCIPGQIKRVIICMGKIYYDLVKKRDQIKQYSITIIRIEQLYPFPSEDIQKILQPYTYVKDFIWCQEEPKNQGAWYYINRYFHVYLPNIKLNYIGRAESASPAVGYFSIHQKQQQQIIDNALYLNKNF